MSNQFARIDPCTLKSCTEGCPDGLIPLPSQKSPDCRCVHQDWAKVLQNISPCEYVKSMAPFIAIDLTHPPSPHLPQDFLGAVSAKNFERIQELAVNALDAGRFSQAQYFSAYGILMLGGQAESREQNHLSQIFAQQLIKASEARSDASATLASKRILETLKVLDTHDHQSLDQHLNDVLEKASTMTSALEVNVLKSAFVTESNRLQVSGNQSGARRALAVAHFLGRLNS